MKFGFNEVVVPSKGRAGKVTTTRFFPHATLLVEPQEFVAYQRAYPNNRVVKLPKNDMGIVFARNFVLNNAHSYVVMVDDDLSALSERKECHGDWYSYRIDKEQTPDNRGSLAWGYCTGMLGAGYALCGPQHRTDASRGNAKRLWHFVALNAKLLREHEIRYRVDLFEDYDIQLQVMQSGLLCGTFLNMAFDCPSCGTNEGGLCNPNGRTRAAQQRGITRLLEYWGPEVIKPVEKPRGLEPRFDWLAFGHQLENVVL